MSTALDSLRNLWVACSQGLTMNLSMGPNFSITSASLTSFDTIAIIILVPIYDRILIPILCRWNLAPTYLQRVGIGLGVRLQSECAPITLDTWTLALGPNALKSG